MPLFTVKMFHCSSYWLLRLPVFNRASVAKEFSIQHFRYPIYAKQLSISFYLSLSRRIYRRFVSSIERPRLANVYYFHTATTFQRLRNFTTLVNWYPILLNNRQFGRWSRLLGNEYILCTERRDINVSCLYNKRSCSHSSGKNCQADSLWSSMF